MKNGHGVLISLPTTGG